MEKSRQGPERILAVGEAEEAGQEAAPGPRAVEPPLPLRF